MAQAPKATRISAEEIPDAPEWFIQVLSTLNPFMSDVTSAFQGGISRENIREQYQELEITTASDAYETFRDFKVQLKNKLGVSPTSVQIVSVDGRFDKTVGPALEQKHVVAAADFTNSWVQFGGTSTSAGYFMDSAGTVWMEGFIKSGTVTAAAFTLPAAYRPLTDQTFPAYSNGAFGALQVLAAGTVIPLVGSNVDFAITCSFKAGAGYGVNVGNPVWEYHSNGLIEIKYISGLRPNTTYTLGFVVK